MQSLEDRLRRSGKHYTIVLLSEIFPSKLALFEDIDAYVCVRRGIVLLHIRRKLNRF